MASLGNLTKLETLDMSGCRGDPEELHEQVWAAIRAKRAQEQEVVQAAPSADELEEQAEQLLEEADALRKRAEALLREARRLRERE